MIEQTTEKQLTLYVSEVINSDQGCQFTSKPWVIFLRNYGIEISMTGIAYETYTICKIIKDDLQ